MVNWDKLVTNLERGGFAVSRFATAKEAAAYLNETLDGRTIGFGGSMTLKEMGLYELLGTHNEVYWHMVEGPQARDEAAGTQVYLTSANGLSETGAIINIDGTGNRVSSTLYGHEAVYFVIGVNKIAPDEEAALWRARNIASPRNARRLGRKTPCALGEERCHDCDSPERICRAVVTLLKKPTGIQHMEVVLVEEELGY